MESHRAWVDRWGDAVRGARVVSREAGVGTIGVFYVAGSSRPDGREVSPVEVPDRGALADMIAELAADGPIRVYLTDADGKQIVSKVFSPASASAPASSSGTIGALSPGVESAFKAVCTALIEMASVNTRALEVVSRGRAEEIQRTGEAIHGMIEARREQVEAETVAARALSIVEDSVGQQASPMEEAAGKLLGDLGEFASFFASQKKRAES